tara:strand:- start:4070 stop:4357 length:288 start_codon:yes stop_codon:yes gene_type:complete
MSNEAVNLVEAYYKGLLSNNHPQADILAVIVSKTELLQYFYGSIIMFNCEKNDDGSYKDNADKIADANARVCLIQDELKDLYKQLNKAIDGDKNE